MKVSVVIVSYNARYYLEQCLYSVQAALERYGGEIIVVDNDSPEKPIEQIRDKFPRVNFIESPINLGFGRANNLGVKKARGEYVLILNPDTIVSETIFDEILVFAEKQEKLGALGVRLVDANGKFHPECKRNIPTLGNTFGKLFGTLIDKGGARGYYKSEVGEFDIAQAEILVGAFMLLKKEVYQKVGGFDERYFMYGEDIDLSYTLTLNGYENYYFGKSTAIHYKGESTRKDKKYLKIFFGAMRLFVDKYYKKNWFKYALFILGLKFRYVWAYLNGVFKPSDKIIQSKLDKEQLLTVKSKGEITKNSAQSYLLDGTVFTHREMIQIISNYTSPVSKFYIQPKNMNVILSSDGVEMISE
ncbi:MAG: glycosyltransferase family 2 protein [Moheibacter sp.]